MRLPENFRSADLRSKTIELMPYQHKLKFVPLLAKEWRELLASRSFWLLLLMIGPLVGHAFISAVGLYAEASGIGGGPAAAGPGSDAT